MAPGVDAALGLEEDAHLCWKKESPLSLFPSILGTAVPMATCLGVAVAVGPIDEALTSSKSSLNLYIGFGL